VCVFVFLCLCQVLMNADCWSVVENVKADELGYNVLCVVINECFSSSIVLWLTVRN
jgi:hypothetical protein